VAVNTSALYQGAVSRKLERDTLDVAQRFLVVYQFADKKKMERGAGTSWTATRFNRLPLPYAPLSEGVPPIGETLTISQVTGVALQWGDKITFTDVAQTTIQYDLLDQAPNRLGMQVAELKERNCFNILMGGTQVNYVNARGARASLVAGDVLDPATVNRTVANLKLLGAPLWNGQTGETVNRSIERNVRQSEMGPKTAEHYVAVGNTLVFNDFASNATVVQAWSFSDVTRLYINEAGYWRGMHFCESNMIPSWTGVAAVSGTGGTAGALATDDYYIQVTASDSQTQYEKLIYQVSTGISVTGATGSISLTLPSTANYTYSVYVGTTTSPQNLGLCASGPSTGPYAGQATQLAPGASVVITGIGLFQVPPAAPATGITVYPTFVFGRNAFAGLELENITWTRLFEADKADPLNQLRVIGYKFFEGWVILNQQFMARIESTASTSGAFG
jgi:N4-gp56 family major capsid protein